MKTTALKPIVFTALFVASFSVAYLASGCAGTPTKESSGEYVDDSTITIKVKAAFVSDPVVKALDVNVETFKGVVQLSGFVNTATEKVQAGHLATTVKGVTSVKNNITVK